MSHTRYDNATQIRVLSSTAAMLLVIAARPAGAALPVIRQQPDVQFEEANQRNKQHPAKILAQQPSLIKRDPHCTLPGHHGRRLNR